MGYQLPCSAAAVLPSTRETPVWPRYCRSRGSMLAKEPSGPPSPRRTVLCTGRRARATTRGSASTATLRPTESRSLSSTAQVWTASGFLKVTTSPVEGRTPPGPTWTATAPPRSTTTSTTKMSSLSPPSSTPTTPLTRSPPSRLETWPVTWLEDTSPPPPGLFLVSPPLPGTDSSPLDRSSSTDSPRVSTSTSSPRNNHTLYSTCFRVQSMLSYLLNSKMLPAVSAELKCTFIMTGFCRIKIP